MPVPKRTLANGQVAVGEVGYGAMNLTWKPTQTPDEQAFAVIKQAVDLNGDALTMVNSGEFYGQAPHGTLGLELLSRFFAAEPSYASRIFLSVKGGLSARFQPDSSLENLRKSAENINRILKHRKMDLFEPARVDTTRPIEEAMANLQTLVKEGHFQYIGLSECKEETLRRAVAAGPVAAIEVEYSPWALDIETNGVLAAAKELDVTVISYSPLGRGFLTGSIKSRADIPKGDHRLDFDRFSEENFPINLKLVEKLSAIASKKGVSPAQLALAWNLAQWEKIIPIPGSTRVEGVIEAAGASNVKLSQEELDEVREVINGTKIIGGRYNSHLEGALAR